MALLFTTLTTLVLFIIAYLYINNKVDKEMIRDYEHLVTLGSTWSTSVRDGCPWDHIYVKVINKRQFKNHKYVTYMDINDGEQLTCELAHFLNYFTHHRS